MENNILIYLLFIYSFACSTSALYFVMNNHDIKTFMEDVPIGTNIVCDYILQTIKPGTDRHADSEYSIHVDVINPEYTTILSRTYSARGKFAFTTEISGEHTIRISTSAKDGRWNENDQLKVHLDLLVGDHAVDYTQVASNEHLNDIELRIRQLTDQADQIARELEYQKEREDGFRTVSENTNIRVLWWALAQFSLLVVIGIWQMRHLKVFFEAKKLV